MLLGIGFLFYSAILAGLCILVRWEFKRLRPANQPTDNRP